MKTSPKDGMLPAAFVALGTLTTVALTDPNVPPIGALVSSAIVWWCTTLFLVTLKDSLLRTRGE
jgi:hypothetical protein